MVGCALRVYLNNGDCFIVVLHGCNNYSYPQTMNPLIKAIAGLLNCTLGDHMDTSYNCESYNVVYNDWEEGASRGQGPDDFYITIDWHKTEVELCTQGSDKLVKTIKFNFKVEASIQP